MKIAELCGAPDRRKSRLPVTSSIGRTARYARMVRPIAAGCFAIGLDRRRFALRLSRPMEPTVILVIG